LDKWDKIGALKPAGLEEESIRTSGEALPSVKNERRVIGAKAGLSSKRAKGKNSFKGCRDKDPVQSRADRVKLTVRPGETRPSARNFS
jgi:hypothetical protein